MARGLWPSVAWDHPPAPPRIRWGTQRPRIQIRIHFLGAPPPIHLPWIRGGWGGGGREGENRILWLYLARNHFIQFSPGVKGVKGTGGPPPRPAGLGGGGFYLVLNQFIQFFPRGVGGGQRGPRLLGGDLSRNGQLAPVTYSGRVGGSGARQAMAGKLNIMLSPEIES